MILRNREEYSRCFQKNVSCPPSSSGVHALWPQLPLFDQRGLSRRCRSLGMAVQLHPDRGDLMQRGTPQDVRSYIPRLLDNFDTASGGSWLYLEIDPGFKWENIQALFECAMNLRGGGKQSSADRSGA
jgi:hypothetical protein